MKIKQFLFIFFIIILLVSPFVSSANHNNHPQDYIDDIIAAVNIDLVKGYIQSLQDFGSRVTGTTASTLCGNYIHQEFQEMGYTVEFLPWSNGGYDDRNIEAVLPGTTDKSIIICAHYDSVPGSPGADDNGSGTAAVLAAAKVLSEMQEEEFYYTIRFVTFSGEEEGLLGSYVYAEHSNNTNTPLLCTLNVDMIGYTRSETGAENIYIYEGDRSKWITNITLGVSETYEEHIGLTVNRQHAGPNSDHWPFIHYGYDAIFFHEYDFNDYYHSSNDTVDKMDLDYDTRCTRFIVATLLRLANLDVIDNDPPKVAIIRPVDNYLYISDREIIPVWGTIIIGGITVQVHTSDEKTGIDKVELYIDDVLEKKIFTYPYSFLWDNFALFSHDIKIDSYDNAGNMASLEKKVWIFNV